MTMHHLLTPLPLAALAGPALARLQPPSDEAKANAAEAAVKTAHGGKVENDKPCLATDEVAAGDQAATKK